MSVSTLDVLDLGLFSATGLLTLNSRVLTELAERGVVSSRSFPVPDYAKLLVAEGLGGQLTPAPSTPGDVVVSAEDAGGEGRRVQVRSRVQHDGSAAPAFAAVRSSAADTFLFVLLDEEGLAVREAVEVPVAEVEGARPTLEDVRELPGAADVTDRLEDAQRRVDTYGRTVSTAGRPTLPSPRNPWTQLERVTLPAVPTAVVRRSGVTLSDLPEVFDAGFSLLAASIEPAGPAFAVYRGDPATTFDIEVGYPVAEPLAAGADLEGVEGSELPAGPAVALSHLGGYEGLGPAWARLTAAVADGGPTADRALLEVYVTRPTPTADPATLRTDLFVPLGAEG